MDDHAILAQCATTGDVQLLGELAQRYEPLIRAVALREGADSDMAEDITQSALLVLMRKRGLLGNDRPVKAWLARVTRYLTIDALRGKSARLKYERLAAQERGETVDAEFREVESIIKTTLQQLSDSDRTILERRYLQTRGIDEIAREFGITEPAARQRISRALARLRELLEGRGIRQEDLLATLLIRLGSTAGGHSSSRHPVRIKAVVAIGVICALTAGSVVAWQAKHRSSLSLRANAATGQQVAPAPPINARPDSTVP